MNELTKKPTSLTNMLRQEIVAINLLSIWTHWAVETQLALRLTVFHLLDLHGMLSDIVQLLEQNDDNFAVLQW